MKIAFYLSNKYISSIVASEIENGNPGIGGSEYSALLISTILSRRKNLEIVLLCDEPGKFPNVLQWIPCANLSGAIKYYKRNGFDFLVVDAKFLEKNIVLRFYNVRFVAWANCFIAEDMLRFYANQPNICKIVNVGKEQYELTNNLPIYKKSCYIYNAVPTDFLENYIQSLKPNILREPNVVYIGSLIPSKGFHLLAKAWPKVISKMPSAKLYVIGSAKLYSRNSRLGNWGIASKKYEDTFMQYLTNDGELLKSVHFLGILGNEKYDVLGNCKVGVPNPSGISETFGYTAVEMQIMDCLVTTIKCPGYIDTVFDKKNLYETPDKLSENIIRLLNSNEDVYRNVMKYISKFSPNIIVKEWEEFFLSLSPEENQKISISRRIAIINGFVRYHIHLYYQMHINWIKKVYNFLKHLLRS